LKKRQAQIQEDAASNILVEEYPQHDNQALENLELENLEHEVLNSHTYSDEVVEVSETKNTVTTDNAAVNNQLHNYSQLPQEPLQRSTFPYDAGIVNQPYVSPLIKKWMQSQGYSVSETINLEYQNYPVGMAPQNVPNFNSTQNSTEIPIQDNGGSNSELDEEETQSITLNQPETAPQEVEQTPDATQETPSAWIAEEIVVDDIDEDAANTDLELEETLAPETSVADMLSSLPFTLDDIEVLPVPQINLPKKELVSGNKVRVRILLKEMRPNTAIKLWVEDCQTRWLLEGPHLLTDLLPNPFESGMEVITELNIPFGCVEIRVEAVSIDIATQLESDKVSIQRTVVPPDLPALQFDELLGI
jgi:hypothetical protein